ncbi:unnamed protein product, partial [Prorocentrum cordatum]
MCLIDGVQGEAVLGSDFCAAHGATAASSATTAPAAAAVNMHVDQSTGATQDVADLQMNGTENPGVTQALAEIDAIEVDEETIVRSAAAAHAAGSAAAAAPPAPVPAAAPADAVGPPGLEGRSPREILLQNWVDNEVLHHFELVHSSLPASDAHGPQSIPVKLPQDYSELVSILTRLGYNVSVISLSSAQGWLQDDAAKARTLLDAFIAAAPRCEEALPMIFKERWKIKPDRLCLYRELGLEGNEELWGRLADRVPVLWTPEDKNAQTRLRSSLLRRVADQPRPVTVIMISTIPLTTGLNNITNITDICSFPLLSERWVPLVKDADFIPFPFEHHGLSTFSLRLNNGRCLPRVVNMTPPFQADAARAVTFDMLVDDLQGLIALLSHPLMVGATPRAHRKSHLSIQGVPRLALDVIFPGHLIHFDLLATLRELRRSHLPSTTFFGLKDLAADVDTFILECNGPGAFHHYWALCFQMSALSAT